MIKALWYCGPVIQVMLFCCMASTSFRLICRLELPASKLANWLWFSRYSLRVDCTENAFSCSSYVAECHSHHGRLYRKHCFQQLSAAACVYAVAITCFWCYGNLFAELFPSNSHLCWLHSSDFQQMCHSTVRIQIICSYLSSLFYLNEKKKKSNFFLYLIHQVIQTIW
jgi:hypothetical protein